MWYLLRHPETQLNKEQKYHGWGYAPYTELGELQFLKTLKFTQNIKADIVLSSDLKRCLGLAQQISSKKGLQLVQSTMLRELNFGKWHGHTYNYLNKEYNLQMKKWVEDPWKNAPIDGETLSQLKERCIKFKQEYQNENAIIVTHGGVIAVFQYLIKQIDYWRLLPKNSECIIIDWQDKTIESKTI